MYPVANRDLASSSFKSAAAGIQTVRTAPVLRRWLWPLAVLALVTPVTAIASLGRDSPGPEETSSAEMSFALRYTATFSKDDVHFGKGWGFDRLRVAGCDCLGEPGKPALPAKAVPIALPPGMKVTAVRSTATTVELPGKYNVYPAQPPRALTDTIDQSGFTQPDPETYASAAAWPTDWAKLVHQADLAGQSIAVLRVYPLRYVPATRKLTLATSINIVLEGTSGHVCGDYLPARISPAARAAYQRRLTALVINPNDVALAMSPEPGPATYGVDPGAYDYVIITDTQWVNDFQPLADWRTKAGIPTTLVTTDWIYNEGGYPGNDLEQVRAFVEDAHSTWGATYFLLGGDTPVIPYDVKTIEVSGIGTYDVANDTYFADYDEDRVCEVNLSRAPVRTDTHIATFVDKVLGYEKNPPLGGYATSAAFLGFDIFYCGDDQGEIVKERLGNLYLPPEWTLATEYDSEPGTHKADVIDYLNQGYHLVNHCDHSGYTSVGVGWLCHQQILYGSEVEQLTNGNRQSIAFAIGCYPANFPVPTCFGETFLQHPDGGGVAFIGNTSLGLGGGRADPDHYTVRQDSLLYKSWFDDGLYRLGECFTYAKNGVFETYADATNAEFYCFTQLTLLGEPQLAVWTAEPQALLVEHDGVVRLGLSTPFPVRVTSGGDPVEGATVCLWKDGDVYQIELTNSSGTATFDPAPGSEGTMHVTVTRHNYLPYEGQAIVRR